MIITTLGDHRPVVGAAGGFGRFGQRQEHDVGGLVQSSARREFGAGRQELSAYFGEWEEPDELRQLTQTRQLPRPAEHGAGQSRLPRTGSHRAADEPIQPFFCFRRCPGKPHRRRLLRIGDLQIPGQSSEDRRRILGPSGHADIDLGGPADTVLIKKSGLDRGQQRYVADDDAAAAAEDRVLLAGETRLR